MVSAKRIKENLEQINARVAEAAERGGRRPDQVRLVAVCKYVDAEITQSVVNSGALDIGENRPQQLWQKAEQIKVPAVNWHLIGQLQTNKVKRTLTIITLLHSLDRLKLARVIEQQASQVGVCVDALVQVNISGDESKSGFQCSEVESALEQIMECQHIKVKGLMAMAGLDSDLPTTRREFESMRQLQDRLQAKFGDQITLSELSMGMSRDYEMAIEAGATIVRVGSEIFRE